MPKTFDNEDARRGTALSEMGFLRLPEVLRFYPVSKSTWWEMVRTGVAPKPIKLSRRCSAWRVREIYDLLAKAQQTEPSKICNGKEIGFGCTNTPGRSG